MHIRRSNIARFIKKEINGQLGALKLLLCAVRCTDTLAIYRVLKRVPPQGRIARSLTLHYDIKFTSYTKALFNQQRNSNIKKINWQNIKYTQRYFTNNI